MPRPIRPARTLTVLSLALVACGSKSGGVAPDLSTTPTPTADLAAASPDQSVTPPADMAAIMSDMTAVAPPDAATPTSDLGATVFDLATTVTHDLATTVPHDLATAPAPDLATHPADLATMVTHDLATAPAPDLATAPHDMTTTSSPDLAYTGGSGGSGGGSWVPPSGTDDVLVHAPATAISVRSLPGGAGVYDVGADAGGGIWAVNGTTVFYWPAGVNSSGPFTYTQKSAGLARGNSSYPFASVAGANGGQAIIGNRGAIADVMTVNPSSGAVTSVNNMVINCDPNSSTYQECLSQQMFVTAVVRVAVALNGTFDGTAYLGAIHGTSAWHGLDGSCGCIQFQQHVHYIPPSGCDSSPSADGCWGGDVYGEAIAPNGDLWMGDEHFVAHMPQGSLGSSVDFFQNIDIAVDVFPGVNDEVHGLAADGAGGVWVASYGEGLAYLEPNTFLPTYWSRSTVLPQNRLTGVALDTDGSLWVATVNGGIARKTSSGWVYYSGSLPSPNISSIFIDARSLPRRVIIGSDVGVAVYTGP